MIEATPFTGNPELDAAPAGAVTVELSQDELREALTQYIGQKRRESFAGYAIVQIRTDSPSKLTCRVTYWRTET